MERRVVGAQLNFPDTDEEQNEQLFMRLQHISDLRYLDVHVSVLTSEMSAALGNMRQVRVLGIHRDGKARRNTLEFLAAVGRLSQLERLTVEGWGCVGSGDPAHLAGLTNLKSLSLELYSDDEDILVEERGQEWVAAIGKLTGLERLSLSWGFPWLPASPTSRACAVWRV